VTTHELDKPSNCLNNKIFTGFQLTTTSQITKSQGTVPIIAAVILFTLFGLGFFATGFDQGHMFSTVQGQHAYADMYLHEFTHDMRHASGFPCH